LRKKSLRFASENDVGKMLGLLSKTIEENSMFKGQIEELKIELSSSYLAVG